MYTYICIHTYLYLHIYKHTHIHIYKSTYICAYIYKCRYIHIYIYTQLHISICAFIHIHVLAPLKKPCRVRYQTAPSKLSSYQSFLGGNTVELTIPKRLACCESTKPTLFVSAKDYVHMFISMYLKIFIIMCLKGEYNRVPDSYTTSLAAQQHNAQRFLRDTCQRLLEK